MKQWYEKLFENYALGYDQEAFTQGTIQEVDFLEQEIAFNTSLKVLDVGCGTGRHAIELARRGYAVTGVDLSPAQLHRAKQKAVAAGVSISFVQLDARVSGILISGEYLSFNGHIANSQKNDENYNGFYSYDIPRVIAQSDGQAE